MGEGSDKEKEREEVKNRKGGGREIEGGRKEAIGWREEERRREGIGRGSLINLYCSRRLEMKRSSITTKTWHNNPRLT